jgi:hypothetical protein
VSRAAWARAREATRTIARRLAANDPEVVAAVRTGFGRHRALVGAAVVLEIDAQRRRLRARGWTDASLDDVMVDGLRRACPGAHEVERQLWVLAVLDDVNDPATEPASGPNVADVVVDERVTS